MSCARRNADALHELGNVKVPVLVASTSSFASHRPVGHVRVDLGGTGILSCRLIVHLVHVELVLVARQVNFIDDQPVTEDGRKRIVGALVQDDRNRFENDALEDLGPPILLLDLGQLIEPFPVVLDDDDGFYAGGAEPVPLGADSLRREM